MCGGILYTCFCGDFFFSVWPVTFTRLLKECGHMPSRPLPNVVWANWSQCILRVHSLLYFELFLEHPGVNRAFGNLGGQTSAEPRSLLMAESLCATVCTAYISAVRVTFSMVHDVLKNFTLNLWAPSHLSLKKSQILWGLTLSVYKQPPTCHHSR